MQVESVTVRGYRNLAPQKILLGKGLNIFIGDNAQGKTNLLESVYLCCIGKSPRTEKDKDLVRWGEEIAHVRTVYTCRFGEGEIAVGVAGSKKHITVNNVPINKLGELLGYLNCIWFSPADIRIVSQSPAERRRFLDVDLCQTDKNYFYSLGRFNKALAQRNNVLKQTSEDKLADNIFVWDAQIAEEGAKIIAKRRNFCEKLKIYAAESHEKLSTGKEKLSVEYQTQIQGENVAELKENYLKQLRENLRKDFALKYTTVGCQRDDIALKIGTVDVRSFGSQGQQRTGALALKLAELAIFKEINGEYPVLLLDDVLSELDAERQKQLLSFARDTQILLTSAVDVDKSLLPQLPCAKFTLKDGLVTAQ